MLLKLFALFIVTPVVEMALLIEIGKRIGTLQTIAIIVVTGIVGASLAKSQGLRIVRDMKLSVHNGEMPHNQLIEGVLILIGGALLITPGILTDVAGFVLVIPWTRRLIRERLKKYFMGRIDRIQIDGL
ncbi:FxsA family protein [Candidatus Poribacteria bacterium]